MTWDQPYLETCCRAALHRLVLAAGAGRPETGMDAACLARLIGLGLAASRPDGRIAATEAGTARHAADVVGPRAGPGAHPGAA